MSEGRRLFRDTTLAAELDVKPQHLRRLRVTGDGPRFVKIGGAVRYRAEDVEVWLAGRTRSSTSDSGSDNDAR